MKEKHTRLGILILIIGFQSVFTGMILKETYSRVTSPFVLPLLLIIAVGLVATYLKAELHDAHYQYENVWVTLWVPMGAVACYFLSTKAGLGAVIAAGITGTVGSFLPAFFRERSYFRKLPPAVYCGAFVGMCSPEVAPTFGFVLGAGIFAGLLFGLSKSLFSGLGGKLGLLAFGGVVTMAFLFYLLKMPA